MRRNTQAAAAQTAAARTFALAVLPLWSAFVPFPFAQTTSTELFSPSRQGRGSADGGKAESQSCPRSNSVFSHAPALPRKQKTQNKKILTSFLPAAGVATAPSESDEDESSSEEEASTTCRESFGGREEEVERERETARELKRRKKKTNGMEPLAAGISPLPLSFLSSLPSAPLASHTTHLLLLALSGGDGGLLGGLGESGHGC